MKKSSLILFALLVFKFGIRAQELTSKWSDKIELHNSKDGFFSYFLGENERFLYAYFSKKGKSERKKIVAFDKKTMKRQFATEVIGYPSNSKDSKKFKGLDVARCYAKSNERSLKYLSSNPCKLYGVSTLTTPLAPVELWVKISPTL